MLSIARIRSGRSGWPVPLRWLSEAGWVMRRVVMVVPSVASPNLNRIARRERRSLPPLAFDTHARRWGRVAFRDKKHTSQRFSRHGAVPFEIGDAFAGEKTVVDQEMAGKGFCWLEEDRVGGIRHDLGRA